MIKNNRIFKKGFTLIEMTLVVAVFSILIVVTAEVFISFYQISVKTAASRDLGQNLRYSMETISREIRSAEKLEPYVSDKTLYGADLESAKYIPADWSIDKAGEIKILTREGKTVLFYCKNDSGAKCSEANPGSLWQKNDSDDPVQLTPENLLIIEYQVEANGTISEGNTFNIQPKVTIFVRAKSGVPDRAGDYPTISIKNTISKRNYYDLSFGNGDGPGFSGIEGGHNHVSAYGVDGYGWSWGRGNSYLNNGEVNNCPVPKKLRSTWDEWLNSPIKHLNNIIALGSGDYHTLAAKADGTVWSWGVGFLGDGRSTSAFAVQRSTNPVRVVGLNGVGYLSDIIKLEAGSRISYALDKEGKIYVWGAGNLGVSGYGTALTNVPLRVYDNGVRQIDISTGDISDYPYGMSCSVTYQGSVTCWGSGRLGTERVEDYYNCTVYKETRTAVVSPTGNWGLFSGAVSVSVSKTGQYTMALKSDGTVWSWGTNSSGQLGLGTTSVSCRPKQVKKNVSGVISELDGIVAIDTGTARSLALDVNGNVWQWGAGVTSYATLVRGEGGVGLLDNVSAITATTGSFHALKRDGTVWSWGANSLAQLGDDSTTSRLYPVRTGLVINYNLENK